MNWKTQRYYIVDSMAPGRQPAEISIFLPVYRESEFLENNLEKLVNDSSARKEVFVAIDKPTERSMETYKKYRNRANFSISNVRRGKVNALNEVTKKADAGLFLFLDADVKITDGNGFLRKILDGMEGFEIGVLNAIGIRDTVLSKMVYCETTVGANTIQKMFHKIVGKSIAVYGGAMVISKETFDDLGGFERVIYEDIELALESYIKNKRYKFLEDVKVLNRAPVSWKSWYRQRVRWGSGSGLWIRNHFKELLSFTVKYPQIFIRCLFFWLPFFSVGILSTLLAGPLTGAASLGLFLLSMKLGITIPFLMLFSMGLIFRQIIASLLSFLIFSIIYRYYAKRMGYEFYVLDYAIFTYVYSFVSVTVHMASMLVAMVLGKVEVKDWRV